MRTKNILELDCLVCSEKIQAIGCGLTESDVERLRRIADAVQLNTGEALVHEGDTPAFYYQLTDGVVGQYKYLPTGRRVMLEILFAGDFLGPGAGDTYAFSCSALTKVTLCRFRKAKMDQLIQDVPELKDKIRMFQENALSKARAHLLGLNQRTPKEKVASFLLFLFDNLYLPTNSENTFEIPMGRSEIADYMSLTSETVSRAMTELSQEGFISLETPKRVKIFDPAKLGEKIHGENLQNASQPRLAG